MIETERLIFRKFTVEDTPLLIEQRSDPDVNRYLGGQELQNPVALTQRVKFYISCYEKYGFGMCVMIWRQTGEIIGSAGIQPLYGTSDIEVGYSMFKDFWGLGIGTEAARGWLNFGFTVAGLDKIVAVAHLENTASRRIMEKLGMTYKKTEYHYNADCAFYSITRTEFLNTANDTTQLP